MAMDTITLIKLFNRSLEKTKHHSFQNLYSEEPEKMNQFIQKLFQRKYFKQMIVFYNDLNKEHVNNQVILIQKYNDSNYSFPFRK
jgi:hypothetical protein